MEEGLLVPRRAISLAKQFLEASFDVVALQETRTRLAGTVFLGTLSFPLTLAPKPFTVYSFGFARLPQIAGPMIVLPFGTDRFSHF